MNHLDASLITALKTPFTAKGEIDFEAFERLVLRQIASGISAFVVAGSTGDGCFLSNGEQLELIRITRSVAGKNAAVIGATSSLSTRDMTHQTARGFEAGMSASLQLPPYYIRPGMQAVVEHLRAALEVGPGIIYNVPHRTGVDVGVEEILNLSTHKNFLGVKECTGLERSLALHQQGIRVWSGNDSTAANEIQSGAASGIISVVSNLAPQTAQQLFSPQKKLSAASLEKMIMQLGNFPNPVGISTLMSMVGLVEPVLWRPYNIISTVAQEKMIPILLELTAQERDFKTPRVLDEKEWSLI